MLFTFNSMNKNKPKYLFLHCGYLYMALTCFGVQILFPDEVSLFFFFLLLLPKSSRFIGASWLNEVSFKSVSPYQTFRSTLLNLKGQETQGIGRGTAGPQRPLRFDLIKSQSVSQCYPVKDTKHSGKLDDTLDKGRDDPQKPAKKLMFSYHATCTQHPRTTRKAEKTTVGEGLILQHGP